ncbi:restriction endonuclease subunit S [uncultured Tenacibaculum sp.]|uniref:restriction endonuclease subunit S n=1 Tax=uncultured Tenacibaculum sp. TaxID=174713 RepID=UPI00261952E5|nr:restriction endonuclease subunit S [uncultured Tenacibaculum sp.]
MSNKEKKIVPELRFSEFKDEWKPTTIEKNCNLKGRIGFRGYTKSDLVAKGEGALVLGGKHIQNQKLDLSDPTYLNWEKYYESPEIMVEVGHIIFSQRGSLGDCALIDEEIGKATINPSMVLLKDITCNEKFLYYILIGKYIQREVERISTNTAVPMLSQKQIKEFPFFKPSPKEQQKIANCLSSLDEVITAETKKLDLLQEHKKGLLQQLFPQVGDVLSGVEVRKQPKYRFPDFENDGDWKETTLKDICDITNGKSNAQDHIENGEYPLFDRSEVIKASDKFLFDCEAVILPGEGMRFIPKYYSGKFDLHQRAYALKDFNCNGKYVYYYMLANSNLLASKAVQSTVLSLRLPILQKFPIIIPIGDKGKLEQQKIANCLSSVDELIEAQTQKIEDLHEHKKGLLQQLFPNINDVVV